MSSRSSSAHSQVNESNYSRTNKTPSDTPADQLRTVGVLPDVAGLDSAFDYIFPEKFNEPEVGMRVRVPLHGRSVAGWIVDTDTVPPHDKTLREVSKISGWGPTADLIDLANWAAWRWAAKSNTFLQTASPLRNVYTLPNTAKVLSLNDHKPFSVLLHRWPPAQDPYPLIKDAVSNGPSLILLPLLRNAQRLVTRLRNDGLNIAFYRDDWASARAGGVSVVGTMSAAWAPIHPLKRVVVLDAHDRGLRQEGAPTWDAVEIAVERARRANVPVDLLSPAPRLEHLAIGKLIEPNPHDEKLGWANIGVVDMREEDPHNGLFSEAATQVVRNYRKVVCILNRKGRATLIACVSCKSIPNCSRCTGRLVPGDGSQLICNRCQFMQPTVCTRCGATKFKQVRIGVQLAAEQLELRSGRSVGEVTAESETLPDTEVLLGTEAVLNRIGTADAVVFLDFDQELFAHSIRSDEDALLLLARASKLVRGKPGRVLVQTRQPNHIVVDAATAPNPGLVNRANEPFRRIMGFAPFGAVATVGGPNAADFVAQAPQGIEVLGPDDGTFMLKAGSIETLCDSLAAMKRPSGRLGLRVDPYGI